MRNWIEKSEVPRERHGTVNEGVVVVMSEDREPSRMRVEAGPVVVAGFGWELDWSITTQDGVPFDRGFEECPFPFWEMRRELPSMQ
ncbi:hypothetical protein CEP54_008453 [Fusarium duplospermum]|uniref:Uncharacterized protein n=1 Tax=Fusarium duplospermum TaxID=1325734 RepID=A0A428PVW9_9HYPO|nr:hypothetical protein CEP54_008453 [Fusarium duplospermum]